MRPSHWHPGEIKPVMTLDEFRDQLWGIDLMAQRAPLPWPPRPADLPDSLLALNAATAVRELVDDWETASERLGYPVNAAEDAPEVSP